MRYKEIFKNLLLSFFSYAMPTAVLQFVIQPIIAARLGGEANGEYLTLMSLNYFFIGITATVLNTVRMLRNTEYEKSGKVGDFSIFFWGYALVLSVFMPIGFVLYTGKADAFDILLYVAIALLYLYHDYIFAQYRLGLDYKKILINNCILVLGYFIGIAIFSVWPKWQIVIICAYFLGAVYDFFNTSFIKEPLVRTPLFSETAKKILLLTCSQALLVAVTYFDKLLLYPLLGGTAVSVYTTASLVGKMLILLSSPLSSVLLSYLVQKDGISVRITKKKVLVGAALAVAAYGVCVLIGYPLTGLLYPAWAGESQKYIPITVATSVFMLISELLNTIVIRYYKTSFQVSLQGGNLALYLLLSLIFMHFWSLWGFCLGGAIAAFIKLLVLSGILLRVNSKKEGI